MTKIKNTNLGGIDYIAGDSLYKDEFLNTAVQIYNVNTPGLIQEGLNKLRDGIAGVFLESTEESNILSIFDSASGTNERVNFVKTTAYFDTNCYTDKINLFDKIYYDSGGPWDNFENAFDGNTVTYSEIYANETEGRPNAETDLLFVYPDSGVYVGSFALKVLQGVGASSIGSGISVFCRVNWTLLDDSYGSIILFNEGVGDLYAEDYVLFDGDVVINDTVKRIEIEMDSFRPASHDCYVRLYDVSGEGYLHNPEIVLDTGVKSVTRNLINPYNCNNSTLEAAYRLYDGNDDTYAYIELDEAMLEFAVAEYIFYDVNTSNNEAYIGDVEIKLFQGAPTSTPEGIHVTIILQSYNGSSWSTETTLISESSYHGADLTYDGTVTLNKTVSGLRIKCNVSLDEEEDEYFRVYKFNAYTTETLSTHINNPTKQTLLTYLTEANPNQTSQYKLLTTTGSTDYLDANTNNGGIDSIPTQLKMKFNTSTSDSHTTQELKIRGISFYGTNNND